MPPFTFTRAICEVFEQICLNYLDEVTAPTLVLCGCPPEWTKVTALLPISETGNEA